MASNPIGREAQPVTLPGTMPPMPAVARILSRYDRPKVEAFIAVALDLLDVLDGDADAELDGDDADGDFAEDEPAARFARLGNGPGCIIGDPDEAADDQGCDDINDDREQEEWLIPSFGIDQTNLPEQHALGTERSLMQPHLARIRQTRCDRIEYRGWSGG